MSGSNNRLIKIGIIHNYPRAEKVKNELVEINSKNQHYLNPVPRKYKLKNVKTNKPAVPYDIAIGALMAKLDPNLQVNFISPHELSVQKARENDIVFMPIYDLLEALNLTDNGGQIKKNAPNNVRAFKLLKKVIKTAGNVYPNAEYQEFFNSKCTYYAHFQKAGLPVAAFRCLDVTSASNFVTGIVKTVKELKIQKIFFTKPDGGQESIGARKWTLGSGKDEAEQRGSGNFFFESEVELRKKLAEYYKVLGRKFKRVIVQQYLPGLEESEEYDTKGYDSASSENRTFFVGERYQYTVTTDYFCQRQPISDGGPKKMVCCDYDCLTNKQAEAVDDPCEMGSARASCAGPQMSKAILKRTKELANKTIKQFPPIVVNGVTLPPCLNRVDIAVIAKNHDPKRPLYINEVEFVPSLYHTDVRAKVPIYENMAKQYVKIANLYVKKRKAHP